MEIIKDQYFEGERPLYVRHGLYIENVVIGPGESSLKEGSDIEAVRCEFKGSVARDTASSVRGGRSRFAYRI